MQHDLPWQRRRTEVQYNWQERFTSSPKTTHTYRGMLAVQLKLKLEALGNLSSQACRHKDIQVVLSPPRPLSWNRARPHLSLVSRLRTLSSTVGWKSHLAPPPSSKPGWVSSGEAGADWRLCLNPEACTEEAWVVRQHCFKTHFIQNSIQKKRLWQVMSVVFCSTIRTAHHR